MLDKQVAENPYRILGVYIDTSPADESRTVGRIKAFAKVKRSMDIPLRGDKKLGTISRTSSAVTRAQQALEVPKDRVLHALHWYADSSDPWAVYLNGAIDARLAGDAYGAFNFYEQLIFVPENLAAFQHAASRGRCSLDGNEILKIVFETLHIDLGEALPPMLQSPERHRGLAEWLMKTQGPWGYQASFKRLENVSGGTPNEMFEDLKKKWRALQGILDLYGAVSGYDQQYVHAVDESILEHSLQVKRVLDNLREWCTVKPLNAGRANGKCYRPTVVLVRAKAFIAQVAEFVDQTHQHFGSRLSSPDMLAFIRTDLAKKCHNLNEFFKSAIMNRRLPSWPTLIVLFIIVMILFYFIN